MRTQFQLSAFFVASLSLVGCGGAYEPDPLGSTESALCAGLTVTNSEKASFTSGTATNAPPVAGQPDVCTTALGVRCVQFDLRIDLPKNVWHKPGGVQVATRWATDDNALDLYVYKDGVQVGKGEAFLAVISQSILLRNAENGTYQIYVALDAADSLDTSVPFE